MGPDAMILVFWMLSFKPIFSLSSFTYVMQIRDDFGEEFSPLGYMGRDNKLQSASG